MSLAAPQVYVLGEVMLEYADEAGKPSLQGVSGDSYNTAVALAQLGVNTGYITGLGADPDSELIRDELRHWSIGADLIASRDDRRPGSYTIHLDPRGERSFSYDRDNSAARGFFGDRAQLEETLSQLQAGRWLYLTGISLAITGPYCRQYLQEFLADYREGGGQIAFDCNHRPSLWDSAATARTQYLQLMENCDLLFAGREDLAAVGIDDPEGLVQSAPVATRILKRGGDSLLLWQDSRSIEIEFTPVQNIVDSTGAGDIFNAGFLAGLLTGDDLESAARLGQQLGAECLGYRGALLPANYWEDRRDLSRYPQG